MIDKYGRTIKLVNDNGADVYSTDGITISWPEGVSEVVVLSAFEASAPQGWAPVTQVPQIISDRQFFQMAAMDGLVTMDEALAAVQTGAIPPLLQTIVDGIADPLQQFGAKMLLSGATIYDRNHPLTEAVVAHLGWTSDQVDQFFIQAAKL